MCVFATAALALSEKQVLYDSDIRSPEHLLIPFDAIKLVSKIDSLDQLSLDLSSAQSTDYNRLAANRLLQILHAIQVIWIIVLIAHAHPQTAFHISTHLIGRFSCAFVKPHRSFLAGPCRIFN
jgi:diadenosine tetraphosphate (Ap4A) HIT family hydrolase